MGSLQMLLCSIPRRSRGLCLRRWLTTAKMTECRREILFSDYDGCIMEKPSSLCLCCDVCGLKYDCKENEFCSCLVAYAFSHIMYLTLLLIMFGIFVCVYVTASQIFQGQCYGRNSKCLVRAVSPSFEYFSFDNYFFKISGSLPTNTV